MPPHQKEQPLESSSRARWGRRFLRTLIWLVLLPFVLLFLAVVLVYVPPVQNYVRAKAVDFLEEKIGTPVQLDHLALKYPLGLRIDGLLLLDRSGDTLLYAGAVKSNADLSSLISGKVALSGTTLSHVRATIEQRGDSTFNFDYIIEAFTSADTTAAAPVDTSTAPFFSMDGVTLEEIRLSLALVPSRMSMGLVLGRLELDLEEMDPARMRFHVGDILLADTRLRLRTAPGPSEPDTYPDLVNPFAGLDITLDQLELDNVGFSMMNTVSGDSLWLAVDEGDLQVNEMALDEQRIAIKSLEIDGARFGMLQPNAMAAVDTIGTTAPLWLDQNDGFRFWTRGLDVQVEVLSFRESEFQMHFGSLKSAASGFDPDHLVFRSLSMDVENVVVNDDRIAMDLQSFSVMPETGGPLLSAALKLDATKEHIAVADGSLMADEMKVNFSGSAALDDLSTAYRAPDQVPLKMQVHGELALDELGSLLHQLGVTLPEPMDAEETWTTKLTFSGTSNRVDSMALDVRGDQNSVIHLSGRSADLKGLPGSAFHAELKEMVMGQGMRDLIRPYVPANIALPDRLAGSARIDGTGDGMDAQLDLGSDLGDISGTLGAFGLSQRTPDVITADLVVTNADLERLIGDTALSKLSVHVVGQGSGLNSADRTGSLEISPTTFAYLGQDLSGSLLVARLRGDSVFATVRTDAPALAVVADVRGRWPNGTDSIAGALDLRVEQLALEELGWYGHPLNVRGNWIGNGSFSTDGFGSFALTGDSMLLFNGDRSFHFERFDASGRLAADSTRFELDSDALEVAYSANLPIDSVVPRAKERLLSFFRADTTEQMTLGTRMDLRVALPKTEWLTGIVLPELNAIELKEFTALVDDEGLQLTVDVPVFEHRSVTIEDLTISVDAKERSLDGALRVHHIQRDSVHLHGLELTAASGPGSLLITLKEQEDDAAPSYVVPVRFQRTDGDISLHLMDGLILDTAHWTVDPANLLRFQEHGPQAEHFILASGTQKVELLTGPTTTSIRFDRFNMGALLNFVSISDSVPLAAGELSGEVVLPLRDTGALRADMRVKGLVITGQPLGDLVVNARERGADKYDAALTFENGPNTLDAKILYDGTPSTATIDAHADIGLTDMAFLQPFVSGVLYDLGGGLIGTVDWASTSHGKELRGDLTFKNAEVGMVMTGAKYRLKNERMIADEAGFRFDDLTVLDSLGNAFTLDGQVFTNNLASMRFDLTLRTNSFQLVNSAPDPKAFFYGDLLASADLRVTGTDKAPVVKGDLGILSGTDLSVVMPGSEVELVSSDGIVEFTTDLYGTDTTRVATDEERLRDSLKAQLPRMDLDLHIRVDPKAGFAVVLDPTTGDQATFKGEGDLRFRYTPERQMLLTGPFTVSEGGYTLEFYGLVKKRFDLVPGSQVTWSGDPLAARMDIKARYVSESAAYPLVASSGSLTEVERNRLSTRMPFEVIINIGGAMKKPDISFALDLPREFRNSYPKVDQELDRLAGNGQDEERNRQVFGLLVLNSFIEDEGTGNAPSSGIASSAARNSINGILTDQLNKVTGRLVRGVDIQLGVNTVDQAQGSTVYQRTSVDYKVSKSILNERLSFEVGGSVGVNEKNNDVSNVSSTRAAQYAILYDLTKDGRFRLRGFFENAFDLYDGEITDSGVALMFTHDFEENEIAREKARQAARKREKEEMKRKQTERKVEEERGPDLAAPEGISDP